MENADNLSFWEWSDLVQTELQKLGSPLTISSISLGAKHRAFRAGITPAQFASDPYASVPVNKTRLVSSARSCLWSIAGTLTLLTLGLIVAYSLTKDQIPAIDADTGPVYDVSAEHIAKAYSTNEVSANGQYQGKTIRVSGVIARVTDNPPTIWLSDNAESDISVNSVLCEFDQDDRYNIVRLTTGHEVHIKGTVKGAWQGYVPRLVHCQVQP